MTNSKALQTILSGVKHVTRCTHIAPSLVKQDVQPTQNIFLIYVLKYSVLVVVTRCNVFNFIRMHG